MDKITKLLQKITVKNRENLLTIINKIISGDQQLPIIKIKNTDFYRLRYKNFRIIFHKQSSNIIIDSIKMRNDNTYKNLN